jgi:hypothetical protein
MCKPNFITFVGVLNACANIFAFQEGKHAHAHIIQNGLEFDVFVGSSLVDMYAKCGSIADAWIMFNKMPFQNVVISNAMVLGHAKCGQW